MIHPETNSTKSVRGVFIIDPNNIIQALYFYPMNVGRSTDELIRMVTALKTTAADNVMTPVNWRAGNDVLIPYVPGKDSEKAEPQRTIIIPYPGIYGTKRVRHHPWGIR